MHSVGWKTFFFSVFIVSEKNVEAFCFDFRFAFTAMPLVIKFTFHILFKENSFRFFSSSNVAINQETTNERKIFMHIFFSAFHLILYAFLKSIKKMFINAKSTSTSFSNVFFYCRHNSIYPLMELQLYLGIRFSLFFFSTQNHVF